MLAIDAQCHQGVLAEFAAHPGLDRVQVGQIGQRRNLVAVFLRVDAHALVAGQIDQQGAAFGRVGVDQGGTRHIDHAHQGLGDLLGARFPLEHAKALEPDQQAGADEQGDEKEGAPKYAARPVGQRCLHDVARARLIGRRRGHRYRHPG